MTKELESFSPMEREVDIRRAHAIDILNTGAIPANEIEKRPGPGGRTLSYVKHTYATRLLQDGLGSMWSFEALEWKVYEDTLFKWTGSGDKRKKTPFDQRSVAARVRLSITYPTRDTSPDQWHKQHFTEIGAFEPNEGMTSANAVAAAVSRGLCKCLMRATGVGLELYEDDNTQGPTPQQAWNILKRYLERRGIEWNDEFKAKLTKKLKDNGISSENIVEEYTKAYEIANTFLEGDEAIPDDL